MTQTELRIQEIVNVDVYPVTDPNAPAPWAERLKRVFKIDVSVCSRCGGDAERRPVKIIACIEDPLVIKKILGYR